MITWEPCVTKKKKSRNMVESQGEEESKGRKIVDEKGTSRKKKDEKAKTWWNLACLECCLYIPAFCISYVGSLSLSLDNKGDQPIQLSGIDVILSAPQTSRGYDNISRLCAIAQRVFLFFFFFSCAFIPLFFFRAAVGHTRRFASLRQLRCFSFLLLLLDRLARTLPIRLNSYHALLKKQKTPNQKTFLLFRFSLFITFTVLLSC